VYKTKCIVKHPISKVYPRKKLAYYSITQNSQEDKVLEILAVQKKPDIDDLVCNDLDIFTRLHHVKVKNGTPLCPKNVDHAQPFTQYRGHLFILTNVITIVIFSLEKHILTIS